MQRVGLLSSPGFPTFWECHFINLSSPTAASVRMSLTANAVEAVSLCALEQPDWVILDLNLARADGLSITRQICRAHPRTRVIVVADDGDVRVRDRATRAGVKLYVMKERMIEIPLLLDAA